MRILELTEETKGNILENLLREAPTATANLKPAYRKSLKRYVPTEMLHYLTIQRDLMAQRLIKIIF